MKSGKHMKKTMLILLFGLLTVVGLPMVTEAVEPVNATDTTIFGAQAWYLIAQRIKQISYRRC